NTETQYTMPEGDAGAELDFDFDDEDFDDENNDLMRILGIAGGVAALVGGLMLLMGRKQETPAEKVMSEVRSTGKDLRRRASQVDIAELLSEARDQANRRLRDADLRDLTRDVRKGGRELARTARHTGRDLAQYAERSAGKVDLEAFIGEIGDRLATLEREGRRGARRAQKEGRKALKNVDLSSLPDDVSSQLSDVWDGVSKRAKDIGWEDAVAEAGKDIRRISRQVRKSGGNLDLGSLTDLLDGLRGQISKASEDVQDSLEGDVLPEARKRARAAGEALSAAAGEARKRGGKLADDYAPEIKKRAGKTAEGAKGLSDQLGGVLQAVGLELMHRMLNDLLPGAKKGGQQVADTVQNDTLPWLRHRAGEVRDRVRDDVAPRVRDVASEVPGLVRDAVDTAGPVVGDTLSSAAGAVGDAVARVRPKVGDAVEGGRDAVRSGSSGVSGAISNVGRKAGDAAGAAVDTTKYVTGETSRIVFWLSMLSGMILMVFVPDADKQKEIWNNMQEFFGELRGMWGDIDEDDLDAQEYTGDAGV
ncbi:MAG TPA: hypothetical protein VM536_06650, partial [Chloroflexia bacterium]|nr:hypothetical protein [Chloroflexia bacterium]